MIKTSLALPVLAAACAAAILAGCGGGGESSGSDPATLAPAGASFPGTNGLIAFTSLRDGNRNIYVTTGAAATETQLTMSGADDITPSISADGTKIVFVSYRPAPPAALGSEEYNERFVDRVKRAS